MKKGILIIFLISFLLPSFSTLGNTYQKSLWTYDAMRKKETPLRDWSLKTSGEVKGLAEWTRIRFGLLSKPITMDCQFKNQIIQLRIEPYYILLVNLPIAVILSVGYVLLTAAIRMRRKVEE